MLKKVFYFHLIFLMSISVLNYSSDSQNSIRAVSKRAVRNRLNENKMHLKGILSAITGRSLVAYEDDPDDFKKKSST